MATTNLNIRTDKEVKDKAEEIFSELGLNMTTAVNIFSRTAIREHGIPFELKLDIPNDITAAAIELKAEKLCLTQTLRDIQAWMHCERLWKYEVRDVQFHLFNFSESGFGFYIIFANSTTEIISINL